jgi:hypothetical protein
MLCKRTDNLIGISELKDLCPLGAVTLLGNFAEAVFHQSLPSRLIARQLTIFF